MCTRVLRYVAHTALLSSAISYDFRYENTHISENIVGRVIFYMSFCSPFSPLCYPYDQIFVLVFESFVILPYVRPTSRPKCLVMHLNGLERFCGYPPPGITCSGGNSSMSIFGSGSKCLFVVFTTFFGRGDMKKIFLSSGPQLCMLKNIHETYYWKAL